MAPTLSWRKKTVSSAVPSAMLQACAMNLVVPTLSADAAKSFQNVKVQSAPIADDGDSTDPGDFQSQSPSSRTSSDHEGSDDESPSPSPVKTMSWSRSLQLRREAKKNGCLDDAEVMRHVNSILNKLTPEKFESLYAQLLSCGISAGAHLEMLVHEISEKASTQTHFAGMYADLSERLGEVLAEDGEGRDLGDILLLHSQKWFDVLLKFPLENAGEAEEVMAETQAKHKARLLGNIRFTGELIIRGIISSKTILVWCKALVQEPLAPACLEALAIILVSVGPKFDTLANPMHRQLREVFWQVRGITFDMGVPARVRYLLRDVLDRKDAGWADVRATIRTETPKCLKDVREVKPKPNLVPQDHGFAFVPPILSQVAPQNVPAMLPMMALIPMMIMTPQQMMYAAQPPLRDVEPPLTKKRNMKLQNKSLAKSSGDA